MENSSLARQSSELTTTQTQSSQDLVLSKMLLLSAQVAGREILPGEVRLWSETFKRTNPATLELAFRNYLKTAKFFPKPGDIWDCIEQIRGAVSDNREQVNRLEIEREQESAEWQAVSLKARQRLAQIADGAFLPARNSRAKIKAQAEQIAQKRQAAEKSQNVSTGK
jgi:hypothetical protein